jgi:hypothetical protein
LASENHPVGFFRPALVSIFLDQRFPQIIYSALDHLATDTRDVDDLNGLLVKKRPVGR